MALPSVKQTDGEKEREWGCVGEGWGGWERSRGSSDSAHRSNEHTLSLCLRSGAERTMGTYTLSAPQGLILGRFSPKCLSH